MQIFDVTGMYVFIRSMDTTDQLKLIQNGWFGQEVPFSIQVIAMDLHEAFNKAYQSIRVIALEIDEKRRLRQTDNATITVDNQMFHHAEHKPLQPATDIQFLSINFVNTGKKVIL